MTVAGFAVAAPDFLIRPPCDLITGTTLSLRALPGEAFAPGCLVFVDENKSYYGWDAASTAADSPPDIIVPNVTVGGKGRWVLLATLGGGIPATPSYSDASTGLTSTISVVDVALLRQNLGTPIGFDLAPWEDGNVLMLWCSVAMMTNDGAADNAIFTPRIELTSGISCSSRWAIRIRPISTDLRPAAIGWDP